MANIEKNSRALEDYGRALIQKVLHPIAIFGTPLAILLLTIFFVLFAFSKNSVTGFRSLAGGLLPLLTVTYIYSFQASLIKKMGDIAEMTALVSSLAIGIAIMLMIDLLGSITVPIKEVVLSSTFSMLVFSYVLLPENKVISYFYGIVIGFLLYIIFVGIPTI